MERHRHDAVCRVKSLLNAIPVVDVNIDIQHTGVVL
jgi:hypothetical protein